MASETITLEDLKRLAVQEQEEISEARKQLHSYYDDLADIARYAGRDLHSVYGPKYVVELPGEIRKIYYDGYGGVVQVYTTDCTVMIHFDGYVYEANHREECLPEVARRVQELLATPGLKELLGKARQVEQVVCTTRTCYDSKKRLLERTGEELRRLLGVAN